MIPGSVDRFGCFMVTLGSILARKGPLESLAFLIIHAGIPVLLARPARDVAVWLGPADLVGGSSSYRSKLCLPTGLFWHCAMTVDRRPGVVLAELAMRGM
eukprot:COSAG02_NODE_489_length_21246_cov_49.035702_11_plen_100_part_00